MQVPPTTNPWGPKPPRETPNPEPRIQSCAFNSKTQNPDVKPQTQPETHLLTHGAHAHQASTGPTSFVPAMSTRRVREAGHSGRWAFFN